MYQEFVMFQTLYAEDRKVFKDLVKNLKINLKRFQRVKKIKKDRHWLSCCDDVGTSSIAFGDRLLEFQFWIFQLLTM